MQQMASLRWIASHPVATDADEQGHWFIRGGIDRIDHTGSVNLSSRSEISRASAADPGAIS
ncbi:hypothetical protein [Blastomonas sp. RAC04]|uniref:hypothetical protein n=1 Tax=Blastomonas sp. RAC04 TaxID=1842535 RepID=UPI001496082A|nr:hypothetical protein [Blastomonas sp. RAC04]